MTFSFVSLAVQHFFWHGGEVGRRRARRESRGTRARSRFRRAARCCACKHANPAAASICACPSTTIASSARSDKFNLVVQRVRAAGLAARRRSRGLRRLVDGPYRRALHRRCAAGLRPRAARRAAAELPPGADARRPIRVKPIPYISVKQPGSDGEDLTDYDIIGSNAEGTGLFALDRCPRIDLVCVPSPPGRDLGSTSFVAAARYCERRRALLVWDPPWSWTSADSAVLSVRASAQASRHALTYFPRVQAARRPWPLWRRHAGVRRRGRDARALRPGRRLAPHAARRCDVERRARAAHRRRPEAGVELAAARRQHLRSAAAGRRGAAGQRQLRGRRGARFAVAVLERGSADVVRPALARGADALGVHRRAPRSARERSREAGLDASCRGSSSAARSPARRRSRRSSCARARRRSRPRQARGVDRAAHRLCAARRRTNSCPTTSATAPRARRPRCALSATPSGTSVSYARSRRRPAFR